MTRVIPKFCLNEIDFSFDIIIIDFLNVYMRFLQGDYDKMNEETFLDFIDTISRHFKNKKIFFVKKVIWELPEEFIRKALKRNRNFRIFFIDVVKTSDNIKCKERDDFVCYSLLNSIPNSVVLSNDLKILNPKKINGGDINIEILSLYELSLDIQTCLKKNLSYKIKGDYSKVIGFKFSRNKKLIK